MLAVLIAISQHSPVKTFFLKHYITKPGIPPMADPMPIMNNKKPGSNILILYSSMLVIPVIRLTMA